MISDPGSWSVTSKLDPRWNKHGRGRVGGFAMPKEAEKWIEQCEKELGTQPTDLTWEYMKD